MLHLAHRSATHDRQPNLSADGSTGHAPNPVFISTREVILTTAAVASTPAATVHRHSTVSTLLGAISHVRVRLPEPHPVYLRRGANYFEGARMSRLMEHL